MPLSTKTVRIHAISLGPLAKRGLRHRNELLAKAKVRALARELSLSTMSAWPLTSSLTMRARGTGAMRLGWLQVVIVTKDNRRRRLIVAPSLAANIAEEKVIALDSVCLEQCPNVRRQ
ncbi:hypothetical protein GCM10007874_40980 [Labrys miyagiensis]|uniref:Uncharacterized protein n=1 Tax=Labrys miyagiensis TaxID=346912 RepID=A0ABQ6CSB7_9HYPH|nr:hypothetical protein [Labrys miyagiensis]GLS21081.1 hypothetical protein GCM10007874_40980 [Labrys miyagiensis]